MRPFSEIIALWESGWQQLFQYIIIIIIHEFYRDTSLEQNFRAAVCHVSHYNTWHGDSKI